MDNFENFLDQAKGLKLSNSEKQGIRGVLSEIVKGAGVSPATDSRLQMSMVPDPAPERHAFDASLDPSEKAAFRARLTNFMEKHPPRKKSKLPWQLGTMLLTLRTMSAMVAALVLLTGAGISAAAEFAVPGDALYPVKRYVNEPVLLAVNVTAQGRVRAQSKIVRRRIKEIETLASRGGWTKEKADHAKHDLDTEITRAHARIAVLAASQPNAASAEEAQLKTSIEEHAAVIARIEADAGAEADIAVALKAEKASSSAEKEEKAMAAVTASGATNVSEEGSSASSADASSSLSESSEKREPLLEGGLELR